jgi:hypothetical protein
MTIRELGRIWRRYSLPWQNFAKLLYTLAKSCQAIKSLFRGKCKACFAESAKQALRKVKSRQSSYTLSAFFLYLLLACVFVWLLLVAVAAVVCCAWFICCDSFFVPAFAAS